jgi:Mlc titration factor MtfA (ptsG expression regulator)
MTGVWILLGAVAIALLFGWLHTRRINGRRKVISEVPLSPNERDVLSVHIGLYDRMPSEVRLALEPKIRVFLDEIGFEACGGLPEVTEEMKLVVAGLACLLLVESGYEDYGKLRSVLLYPDAYRAHDSEASGTVRLGESWNTGSVVLSWRSVAAGALNPDDARNVVLHEFAHQLDQADGVADGLPRLKRRSDYRPWADAFRASYDALCDKVNSGQKTVLDPYGATNPAEFFAVSTETFFEQPRQLSEAHPEVYGQLTEFYGLDPRAW